MKARDRNESVSSKRVAWLDIGKGIAIICVVLGHCITGLDSPLKQAVFTFHMPLFFIYAGITFRPKPLKEQASSSFKRLIIPYVLLFSITALFVLLHADHLSRKLIQDIGLTFVFASAVKVKPWGFAAAGMIWFLVVLFLSRIILNILATSFEKSKMPLIARIALMCALAALGIIAGRFAYLPLSFDLVPLACLFMYAGYEVKEHDALQRATSWPMVCIAIAVWIASMQFCWFSMGDRMFAYAPLAIAGSFAGTIVVSKASQLIERYVAPLKTYLAFMGRNSMLVFALHYIESHIVSWGSMPLLAACGKAWYVLFASRFALIMLIVLIFMYMPISRNKATK